MKDKIKAELDKKSPILLSELYHAVGGEQVGALAFVLAMREMQDDDKVIYTYHGVSMEDRVDPVGYDEPTGVPDAKNLKDIVSMVSKNQSPPKGGT